MKKINPVRLINFTLLLCLINSCGIVSKARYGNGFKLHLWESKACENKKTNPGKSTSKMRLSGIRFLPVKDSIEHTLNPHHSIPSMSTFKSESKPPASDVVNKRNFPQTQDLKRNHKPLNSAENSELRPLEPVTKRAAIIFYGTLALIYITHYLGVFSPLLVSFFGLTLLLGFVLAWVGLSNIRHSYNAFGGRGLAVSIIVLYITMLLYMLMMLLIILLIFGV